MSNANQTLKTLIAEQNEKALIPFLSSLQEAERNALVPTLNKLDNYYSEYVTTAGNTWSSRGSDKQRDMLKTTKYFCYKLKEMKRRSLYLNEAMLDELLPIYQPKWLNQYLNSYDDAQWPPFHLSYIWLMEKQEAGILQPNESVLLRGFGNIIFTCDENFHYHYRPDLLERFPVTLEQHFWTVFTRENELYSASRWIRFGKNNEQEVSKNWLQVIIKLSRSGKLNRRRLLQESLQCTTRDFNRNQISWYLEIIEALAPDVNELLEIQDYVLTALNSPHGKAVKFVLQKIKTLLEHTDFASERFLEQTALLLASETKGTVNSCLILMDKLAKKKVALQADICRKAAEALLHNDSTIQKRASKLMARYGQKEDPMLREAIGSYSDVLLSDAREILAPFLPVVELGHTAAAVIPEQIAACICPERKLELPEHFDDIVYLLSQAVDGNESWHFDLVPAALLKYHETMTMEKADMLAPAFQKAFRIAYGEYDHQRVGYTDELLAYFLYEYMQVLVQQFPGATQLKQLNITQRKKEEKKKADWGGYKSPRVLLRKWKNKSQSGIYNLFKQLLILAMDKIRKQHTLPLLSTPTHQPYWIDPLTFVKRLLDYQEQGATPKSIDWQLAMARVALDNTSDAMAFAKENLRGAFRQISCFLFGSDEVPERLLHANEWKVALSSRDAEAAISCKHPLRELLSVHDQDIGMVDFHVEQRMRSGYIYDYFDKKRVYRRSTSKELIVNHDNHRFNYGSLQRLCYSVANIHLGKHYHYNYFHISDHWLSREAYDMKRMLSLAPNNVEAVLAPFCKRIFKELDEWGEGEKRICVKIAETLVEAWRGGGEMAHLFVAGALAGPDKTTRTLAAEIWIKGVSEGTIDSAQLGAILGRMEEIEFFPLKRVTDIIGDHLMKISDTHDAALRQLIGGIIPWLPATPIRNTKKLLELYRELGANAAEPTASSAVQERLKMWKNNNGLKRLATALMESNSKAA
ncbi:MAG: DUF6493 family protein [Bacteroidota bacterium]